MAARVLLGDDALGFRFALRAAFEGLGAEALICERWGEVVETARAEQPDGILVDLLMPTLDLDALAQTRAVAPEAVLAVISSYTRDELQREIAGVRGIDLVFTKRQPPREIAGALLGRIGPTPPAA